MSLAQKTRPVFQLIIIGLICVCFIFLLIIFSLTLDEKNEESKEAFAKSELIFIIDAGHGGEDGGASSKGGLLEKDLNLSIARKLNSMFISAGYNSVMTRDEDKLLYDINSDYMGRKKILDMRERVRIVKEYENPIFLSIHMNSFPEEKYSGLQVYYSKNSSYSETIAKNVQETVFSFLQPSNNRRIKQSSDIFLLDRINTPAILIECGFLSNAEEASLLADEEYQSKLAFCIFYALTEERE